MTIDLITKTFWYWFFVVGSFRAGSISLVYLTPVGLELDYFQLSYEMMFLVEGD